MPLTPNDLKAIKHLIDTSIQTSLKANNDILLSAIFKYVDETFTTKDELNALEEKISHLPTKDEFYYWMDKLYGELDSERKENTLQQSTLKDHSKRLTRIETHLNLNS